MTALDYQPRRLGEAGKDDLRVLLRLVCKVHWHSCLAMSDSKKEKMTTEEPLSSSADICTFCV